MPGGGDHLDRDKRWAWRRGIALEADLADGAELIGRATITDISEEGCRIHFSSGTDPVRDRVHTLKITGLEAIACYVIWCSDGRAGVEFSQPLDAAMVQSLVMKSHYAKISRRMAHKDGSRDDLPPLGPFPFDE